MTVIKKTNNTKTCEDARGKEPLYTIGGNVKLSSHCGNQYGGSSSN
jgi:hypothetical protein